MGDAPPPSQLSPHAADDVRTVAKGGAVQIGGQITQRSVTLLFTAVLVRVVGTSLFGVYREVTQILVIAGQVGLLGFNYAGMRFVARARARGDHAGVKGAALGALAGAGAASGVVTVVVLAIAGLLAGAFARPGEDAAELARLVRMGAAYVPLFALLQVLRYCTQAYKTMVPSVVAGNIVQPAARFVLGIAALAAGYAVAGAVVTLAISVAAGAAVAGWQLRRLMSEAERSAAASPAVRPLVRFALPQAGASLFGVQTLGLGILLLGVLSSNRQVGLFAIALSLQGPGNVFLGGVVNIWAPVVADLYERGEVARLDSLYKTINRWIATFSLPVFAALIIEADLFARVYTGGESGAAAAVAILALGNIFYTSTGPTGYVISMTGHPGVNFVNSVIAVAIYVGAGIVVVPEHGAAGMAAVDALVTTAVNAARVIEAKVLVGVQPFGRTFLKPVAATAAAAAVLGAVRIAAPDSDLAQIAGLAAAAAVYVGVLRALGLDPEERAVLDTIKDRVLRRGRARARDS